MINRALQHSFVYDMVFLRRISLKPGNSARGRAHIKSMLQKLGKNEY